MRTPIILLVTIAVCSIVLGVGKAAGAADEAKTTKTVPIVMRDPGCHWFSVGGKLKTTLSVKGAVTLVNHDMGTLKVAGHGRLPVGKKITLGRGSYRITMVGQAPDDNHLKLVVA